LLERASAKPLLYKGDIEDKSDCIDSNVVGVVEFNRVNPEFEYRIETFSDSRVVREIMEVVGFQVIRDTNGVNSCIILSIVCIVV
jgi:hypothetical protein